MKTIHWWLRVAGYKNLAFFLSMVFCNRFLDVFQTVLLASWINDKAALESVSVAFLACRCRASLRVMGAARSSLARVGDARAPFGAPPRHPCFGITRATLGAPERCRFGACCSCAVGPRRLKGLRCLFVDGHARR